MIENKKSRTALLCVDLRDGQLWLRSPNNTSLLPDARLIPFIEHQALAVEGVGLDCIISTPAAHADSRYGWAVELMAPALGRR